MSGKNDDEIDASLLSILYEDLDPRQEHAEEQEDKPSHSGDSSALPVPLDLRNHLRSIGAAIITRQLPSQGLSFQLWPAAFSFISLLDRNPSILLLPSAAHIRIVELGSGTGLVGIAASAVLGAHVTLTDLPHVLPNLRFNATANAEVAASRGGLLAVRQLRWGFVEDYAAIGTVHVIIASDVVYYDDLIKPLMETLRFFVKGEVTFLMAHLRRWKKRDALFFRMARKLFEVATIHADPPIPGSRTGVTIYRFTSRIRSPEAAP